MKREASRNGIRVILLKNGVKSYEARIHRNGHQFSECFPTRAAALAWKRGIEADFDKGNFVDVVGGGRTSGDRAGFAAATGGYRGVGVAGQG